VPILLFKPRTRVSRRWDALILVCQRGKELLLFLLLVLWECLVGVFVAAGLVVQHAGHVLGRRRLLFLVPVGGSGEPPRSELLWCIYSARLLDQHGSCGG
jgi:hypothetical protein